MCPLQTSRYQPHKLDLNAPRPQSPTPTPEEAQGDLQVTLRRFRHLCKNGSLDEVVEILNQWPDLPRSTSSLCAAAKSGHVSLIEYLLTQGFFLFPEDSPDSVPQAAASGAQETGNIKVLELLLKRGWDITLGDNAAMSFAMKNEECVRWFLDHGADPNGPSLKHLDLTVTTHAASVAPLSIVKLLLAHGGTVTNTDAVSQAVIGHIKGNPDRLEVVKCLLNYGAPIDVYAYNNYERCVNLIMIEGLENGLHRATRAGEKDMVNLLLKEGADRNKTTGRVAVNRDRWDLTALNIAEMKGFDDIANLLRDEDVLL